MKPTDRFLALFLVFCFSAAAVAAPITFTPPQQESVNKITAKGGLVMQLASDSDLLVVNLSLGGKTTTDAELAEVKNLPKVVQLNLAGTAITDSGLSAVAGLSELTVLHLEKTAVTDAGLANLKNLAKLEYLNLYSTGITDAGLANLSGLKNLKKLYLWQSKVTDAGVNALKQSVPGVIVNRGEELAIVVKVPDPTPAVTGGSATVALNSKCPVSGKPVVLPNTLTHDGKLVAFCCDKCPKEFAKEPAKFAANIKFDIAPPPAKKPDDKKPEDKKPAVKPADAKPVDAKPADAKPADAKPADAKPADVKPAIKTPEVKPVEKNPEAKPADAKPVDAKPADAKVDAKPQVLIPVINTKCPVSDHAIENGFTAIVDGKTVGFCCDKCLAKFNKDPKKFADKIVADAK